MLKKCRLCGSTQLKLLEKIGLENQFSFFRCLSCKLVNYDLEAGTDQKKYAEKFIDPLLEAHPVNKNQTVSYRFVKGFVKNAKSLLEIGFGNGRILYLAHRDGLRVQGVELSPFLVHSVSKRLDIPVKQTDFLTCSSLKEQNYDIVVMRHVLEHFSDSLRVMNRIHYLLSPQGHALIEVPNIDSWELIYKRFMRRHKFYRKRYSKSFVPGHCNEFCKYSFEVLLKKTGFQLISWKTYSHKPVVNFLYRLIPVGNKVRAIIQKV